MLNKEKKSEKEDNQLNIPLYNDDKYNQDIEKKKLDEKLKREKEDKDRLKQEKIMEFKEFNKNLKSIDEIDKYSVLTLLMLLVLGIFSLTKGHLFNLIYCILAGVITFFTARMVVSFYDKDNELDQVLFFNLYKSINDIIYYKTPYDIRKDYKGYLKNISYFSMFCLVFIPSNSILFIISIGLLFLLYFVCYAYNDIKSITDTLDLFIKVSLFGLPFKTVFYLFSNVFIIDFANLALINIFTFMTLLGDIDIDKMIELENENK